MDTSIVSRIIEILDKDTLTPRDRAAVSIMAKDLNADDFSYIFEYAQDVLAGRFENNEDTDIISDIITDLEKPPENKLPTMLPTMYKGIKEENENNENLPSGVPGNSTRGPNVKFVPRITKSSYIQEPPKPMRRLKGTPPRGNTRVYLSNKAKLNAKGGKRKKSRKTRRTQRKY